MTNIIPLIERNPIDAIMELKQEPKDMDIAFETGSMTKSNNRSDSGGKKTAFDAASSMMFWFG